MNLAANRLRAWSLAAVLAVSLTAAASAFLLPVTALDRAILDARFAFARKPAPPRLDAPAEVAVIGIDLHSARAIEEPMALWHARLGRLLEGMRAVTPAAAACPK